MTAVRLDPWQNIKEVGWSGRPDFATFRFRTKLTQDYDTTGVSCVIADSAEWNANLATINSWYDARLSYITSLIIEPEDNYLTNAPHFLKVSNGSLQGWIPTPAYPYIAPAVNVPAFAKSYSWGEFEYYIAGPQSARTSGANYVDPDFPDVAFNYAASLNAIYDMAGEPYGAGTACWGGSYPPFDTSGSYVWHEVLHGVVFMSGETIPITGTLTRGTETYAPVGLTATSAAGGIQFTMLFKRNRT